MKKRASWVRVAGCAVFIVLAGLVLLGERGSRFQTSHSHVRQLLQAPAGVAKSPSPNAQVNWHSAFGKLPLSFEENQGQTAREVRFLAHGQGYQLFLTAQEAVVALKPRQHMDLTPRNRVKSLRAYRQARRAATAAKTQVARMRLEGSNPSAEIAGVDRLPGRTDYFLGSEPKNWRTEIPSYSQVRYHEIYPGIDLLFYGKERRLEYDFVVAPGADPKAIQLKIEGARKLRIGPKGDLSISVAGGLLEFEKPLIYQEVDGARKQVAGNYVQLGKSLVGFAISGYDKSKPLIVDPILNYSTYLGGSSDENQGEAIAVDAAGDAFVAGTTFSTDFPTNPPNNGFQTTAPAVSPAVFLAELDPTGTSLLYSTYLAGQGAIGDAGDFGFGVAVDSAGNAYVTGLTMSTDFPTTTNALIPSPYAVNVNGSAFISKINPAASGAASLVYSSYIAGANGDFGNGVAVDPNQNAYVAGITFSVPEVVAGDGGFQTTPLAFQTTLSNVNGNAFIAVTSTPAAPTTPTLNYASYLGGNGANAGTSNLAIGDEALGVAAGSNGLSPYIAGATSSTDFPTVNGLPNNLAGNTNDAGFVAKFNLDANTGPQSLTYSTTLGGNTFDEANAIALGPSNLTYVAGATNSTNFPTTSGALTIPGTAATGVAFVTVLDTTMSGNSSLIYSTLLGGTGGDTAFGIAADTTNGFAFVTGGTASLDFPITQGALEPTLPAGAPGDAFITKINPDPAGTSTSNLIYSTFFGGSGGGGLPDEATGIAIDSSDNAYVTGVTVSTDLPLAPNPGAFQSTLKGSSDAFVAKLPLVADVTVSPTSIDFGTQIVGATTTAQIVTLTNNTESAVAIASIAVVAVVGPATDFPLGTNTCGSSLAADSQCTVAVAYMPSQTGAESANLNFNFTDPVTGQPATLSVSLSGNGSTTPPDFTITAPATENVMEGQTLQFMATMTPLGGFTGTVNISLSGCPVNTTCTASPTSLAAADGVTPQNSTISVMTTANVVPVGKDPTPPSLPVVVLLVLSVPMYFAPRIQRKVRTRLALAGIILAFLVFVGCGGGHHTPKGPFTLTVTGTSGGVTHSASVMVTVQ